ncbi:MAG: radical SAM protein [Candidatus Thermoplasmatota archaeon]|nr:radical SAM protein [Candidatus Thermoplasmatota archaeon]
MSPKTLPKYKMVIKNDTLPLYLRTKYIPVSYDTMDPLNILWNIHDTAINEMNVIDTKPDTSLLDLKIEIAKKLFSDCIFCEHRCHIDRTKESGKCGVSTSLISSDFIHYGEETIFTPSHTIFFSGCNFKCKFCQNHDISQHQKGLFISPSQLAMRINNAKRNGAININWVGGEPTPHIWYILETLKISDTHLPQLFNSNMYCSRETMNLLSGIIDMYLTDYKFGNDTCARQLAHIPSYNQIVQRNHILAKKQAEIFIRHLVLPNHVSCCSKPVLSWIGTNLPTVPVNIMDQYYPAHTVKRIFGMNRSCSLSEIKEVESFAKSLSIKTYSK